MSFQRNATFWRITDIAGNLTTDIINDMADIDRIYRIGEFFVLALVMMLAAWAYQRFKPEKS